MKIGFTGSRNGMSSQQIVDFKKALHKYIMAGKMISEFHHGCCVGADAIAVLTMCFFFPNTIIIGHPPTNKSKVDRSSIGLSNFLEPETDYLKRNQNIVNVCNLLIAAPDGPPRIRSGTWSTIRYAEKIGREVQII